MVDEIGKMIIDHMDRCYASGMLLQLWIWACILMHWSIYLMPEHCKIHLIPFICLVLLFCIFLFFFFYFLFFFPFLEALPFLLLMFSTSLPCNYLDITVSLNATF